MFSVHKVYAHKHEYKTQKLKGADIFAEQYPAEHGGNHWDDET